MSVESLTTIYRPDVDVTMVYKTSSFDDPAPIVKKNYRYRVVHFLPASVIYTLNNRYPECYIARCNITVA